MSAHVTEYARGYDDGRAFARSWLALLDAENAKLVSDQLTLQASNEILAGKLVRAESEIATLRSAHLHDVHQLGEQSGEIARLREAIRWALGEIGTFGPRRKGVGQYWWRTELRKRAGI